MKTAYELFGVECGPGWRKLIEPLIAECEDAGVEVMQVKEKFGTLRVYTGPCSQALDDKIRTAENESRRVCETCGNVGELRGGGWLYVSCEEHKRK